VFHITKYFLLVLGNLFTHMLNRLWLIKEAGAVLQGAWLEAWYLRKVTPPVTEALWPNVILWEMSCCTIKSLLKIVKKTSNTTGQMTLQWTWRK